MLPDKKEWELKFINNEFYKNLSHAKLKITSFETNWEYKHLGIADAKNTPRYVDFIIYNRLTLTSFYYIDYIAKNSFSDKIFDIGCGINFFSYFFNITGIDQYPSKFIDKVGKFDSKFVLENLEKFDNAIAINSLHFISVFNIVKRIEEFSQIIKPKGYGYITFNISKLANKPYNENIKDLNNRLSYAEELINKINIFNIEIIHKEIYRDNLNDVLDGNIRILFRKI